MDSYLVVPSPLGPLTLLASSGRLCGISLAAPLGCDGQAQPQRGVEENALLAKAHSQLAGYFAGELTAFDVPMRLEGSPFQLAVWEFLAAIPYGETRSYREVAQAVGAPQAARAVGGACARNPLPIVVPCHRVLGSDGRLAGYDGGTHHKRFLLDLEASVVARLVL